MFAAGRETTIHVYDYLSDGTAFWTPLTATDTNIPAGGAVPYIIRGEGSDSFNVDQSTGQFSLSSRVSLGADTKDR